MCCGHALSVELDRDLNIVKALDEGDSRVWIDPLGRECPSDALDAVWYDSGTKCCTDGKYWWHLAHKKSAQLVIDKDEQPPKTHLPKRDFV